MSDQNTEFRAWTILNHLGDIWTQRVFCTEAEARAYLARDAMKGLDNHRVSPVVVRLALSSDAQGRGG